MAKKKLLLIGLLVSLFLISACSLGGKSEDEVFGSEYDYKTASVEVKHEKSQRLQEKREAEEQRQKELELEAQRLKEEQEAEELRIKEEEEAQRLKEEEEKAQKLREEAEAEKIRKKEAEEQELRESEAVKEKEAKVKQEEVKKKQSPSAKGVVRHIESDQQFFDLTKNRNIVTLFYDDNCPYSPAITARRQEIADFFAPSYDFYMVDIKYFSEIRNHYKAYTPKFLVFNNGKEVYSEAGINIIDDPYFTSWFNDSLR